MVLASLLLLAGGSGQSTDPVKTISSQLGALRGVPDSERGATTKAIALEIRELPAGKTQIGLANGLANLSTEGDFGHDTLQEVATTLALALKHQPDPGKADGSYMELAQLVRYEHVNVVLNQEAYKDAIKQLDAVGQTRHAADFTLHDLTGKSWTRSSLKGKVVVVNFWATWCPPCRKEMPDLNALYNEFKDKGLVILAISDEKEETVAKYLSAHPVDYTILLDPGRKVNEAYKMAGIPNSYVYNRAGKLVGEAEDMRTKQQFLRLLNKAGLR